MKDLRRTLRLNIVDWLLNRVRASQPLLICRRSGHRGEQDDPTKFAAITRLWLQFRKPREIFAPHS
jgi:hypothetical protein